MVLLGASTMRPARRGSRAMKRAPRRRHACRAAALPSSWTSAVPITTASATAADRLRGRRVADAEADADRHLHVRADARQHLRRPRRCRGGRRRSRPSATRSRRSRWRCGRPARMRSLGAGRRQQEDQVDAVRAAAARRSPRTPRAGSRPPARRRRRPRAASRTKAPSPCAGRSARSDWRSPSAPPACVSFAGAEAAHHRQHLRHADAHAPARASPAFWITGPSAIGSENGTPSSITSAPAVDHRRASARA